MGTKNNPGEFDCYANAENDEPMFILLARDSLAPQVTAYWVELRARQTRLGQKPPNTKKLNEATQCAFDMEKWRAENR